MNFKPFANRHKIKNVESKDEMNEKNSNLLPLQNEFEFENLYKFFTPRIILKQTDLWQKKLERTQPVKANLT